jgi:hypothetical protein
MSWPATIKDVSIGGVRLLLRRRFEPGTGLQIELPTVDGSDSYSVLVKVVYALSDGQGGWNLGCKFASQLGEDELRRVVQSSPRRDTSTPSPNALSQAVPEKVLAKVAGRTTVPQVHFLLEGPSGSLIDCPIKHLNVPPEWPLPPGKIQTLYALAVEGPLPPLVLQVVRCDQLGEHWTLRCRLLSPSAAELQALFCKFTPA